MSSTSRPSNAAQRAESFSKHLQTTPKTQDTKSNMSVPYKFEGWMGLDKDAVHGKMVWKEFEPKPWTEDDVDIKISHCGICGSDLHCLRSGWWPTKYPCCVGHEIVGQAVKVGKNVKHIKLHQRVGVGAQSGSCLKPDCQECTEGLENYCPRQVTTYDGKYPDGYVSKGGYATYSRHPSHFVFAIPDGLDSAEAAPMLCGGATVWSPLTRNGAGPGKKVGIVGIGGLGHFGLLWSKALGCDKVVAISRNRKKEHDAKAMGADYMIATDEDEGWAKKNRATLDLIVCTVSSPRLPLSDYLKLLKVHGQFIQVGAPEDPIPGFGAFELIGKGVKIGGSAIGSPQEIREMLDFAVKHHIHPYIEEVPMKDANKAVMDMEAGKARYRYVLSNAGIDVLETKE